MTKKLDRLWCNPKFKKFVYSKKADNPDKDILTILDDIADDNEYKKKRKNGNFWGKI